MALVGVRFQVLQVIRLRLIPLKEIQVATLLMLLILELPAQAVAVEHPQRGIQGGR